MEFKKASKLDPKSNLIFLITNEKELPTSSFTKEELSFIKKELKNEHKQVEINRLNSYVFIVLCEKEEGYKTAEKIRISASNLLATLNNKKITAATVVGTASKLTPFIEGIGLGNYQFLKYYSDKKENTFQQLAYITSDKKENISEVNALIVATNHARDLVNEPLSYLTAEQLSKEIKVLGKTYGFKVEVLTKSKIEALKMGGLLAVNKGSIDPPTFSILEWKPAKPKNKKPIILVGKGVVYDTGGLSLKPTPNSMDMMKCDMGGAAAVIGTMVAVAKNKLPYHVVVLVPATDNRPGGNAYVPGDVIKMYNGKTVEVLNTDAEGRMILADALSYADKYQPELVIDVATLTGAAANAIGHYGVVAMGNTPENTMNKLKESGNNTFERIVEFPFWEEYNEQLKSSIADLTNLGNGAGGAITAGKFLEHFTNAPYIHLDIAGPAFIKKQINYHPQGGTGVGVRLLYDFIKNY